MSVDQNISEGTNTRVLIACLVISSIFVALRGWARWYKNRQLPIQAEDLAMYFALISFAIMCALYLAAIPTLYRVMRVVMGLAPPYASMMTDVVPMLKEFFAVQIFFWATLWAVKFSLLLMFQRLTTGLPTYERIWWGVVIFTFLSFVGCVVSQFTSCSSMHAWFTVGGCEAPRDARAKAASLWYALAVDLITDLMIMAVPVQILYNLRISTAQKLSVGVVFVVGTITMIFAVVRVVSLNSDTKNGEVSTSWLILWGAIEGAIAIIVGCLPSFAIFIRGHVAASRGPSYPYATSNPSTGIKSSTYSSRAKARARVESINLNDVESTMPPASSRGSEAELVHGEGAKDESWAGSKEGTREGVASMDGGIIVTQNWTQKWHLGGQKDEEIEKARKLGLRGNI